MKKKLLAILLVLIMVVGMVPTVAFAGGSGTVYLAFTSDVHNGPSGFGGSGGNSSAASERLDNWLDGVSSHLGGISFEAMGFCGDNGSGYAKGDDYWENVQEVMNVVNDNANVGEAYFTAGNHEYMDGYLGSTTNPTAEKIIVMDEAVKTESYIIYCLGASQQNEEYTIENIGKLETYLDEEYESDKPIFILTHFPLHYCGSRVTTNADKVIDLLNNYPNVVFIWGHNHSVSDPNYDDIFEAGSTLAYASGKTKNINFTYCAAGCMSDSDYSTGSGSVEGKGLVAEINGKNIDFTYYDLSYASAGSEPDDPVIPSDVPESGKQYVIVADDGYALTTDEGVGYSNNGSGSQKYNYKGLEGVAYTSGMEITDDMLWTFTASGGGYNISNDGNYLNGEYEQNSTGGYDGTLALSDVKDVWTLSDDSMLKSVNSDKFLTHSNVNSFENLFSVRSQSNASTLEFYEVEDGGIVVPEDPETPDHEIDVTSSSSSSGASASATIKVGDTLAINLTNGSTRTAKNFTNTVADDTVAKIISGNSFELSANGTKTIVVEGLKAGDTTVTCTGTSTSGSTYKATITLTVKDSDTPDDPAEGTIYKKVSAFTAGKEYLIVDESTSSGTFYALTNNGGTSSGTDMDRTEVTVVDDTVDYIETDATNIVWSAAANGGGFYLTNGGGYLVGKGGEVKIYNPIQYPERYWTYVGGKLQHNGGDKAYTVYYSSGKFTSSNNTVDEEVYLFEKVAEQVCDHTYGEWVVTKEATCTQTGTKTRTCSVCDDTETSAIEAKGHTPGEPVRENEVAATETENGSYDEVIYCTVCNEELSRVTKTIPATGGTVYKQVSAFTAGKEYLIVDESTNSGKFYALTNNGGTSSGTDMDRTEVTIVDDTVDYIITDATNIVWSAAANGGGFNLTNDGDYLEGGNNVVKIYSSIQNSGRYWTYVDGKLQHNGGSSGAYTVYYGSGNFTYSRNTSNEVVYLFEKEQECNHNYGEWLVTKEATCTETGIESRTCSVCNKTETRVIEAKGHTEVTDAAIAPTCTATGLTEGKHCAVCNEVIVAQEEILALGHTPGEPVRENEVAATKTKNGSYDEVVYCTVCNEELSRVTKTIPKTGGSGDSGGSGSSGGGGGGVVIHYTLTFNTDGGSAINSLSKSSGTKVDLSAYVPTKDGFVFDGWYANKALTEKITSVMLTKDTTVYAKWTEIEDMGKLPFTDVKDGDWFYGDVEYVYKNCLMMGTSDTTFSSNVTTSRGMIVTILYRLEGEPAVSGNCPFDDVAAGMYYEKAITWAAVNGIVNGYSNDKFGPNDDITREQMASILYHYANYKGYDMSVGEDTNILNFDDASSISEYAIPAFKWACGSGIIYGTSTTTLSPQGNATRAQAAAILRRFCELIEK